MKSEGLETHSKECYRTFYHSEKKNVRKENYESKQRINCSGKVNIQKNVTRFHITLDSLKDNYLFKAKIPQRRVVGL